MRIGLIARADNSGLGMQTYEFYKHMDVTKTMVVDISKFNNNKQYPDRYPGATYIYGFPSDQQIDDFLQDLDVVFTAESPYNFYLYTRSRELGVKVAVQYNYEFFDWFARPELPKPDMVIAPSKWHYGVVDQWAKQNGVRHCYLHCPVNRQALPFREISEAKTFLHQAGRSAAFDRNGTEIVIKASKYVTSDVKILIHFQGEQGLAHQATRTYEEYLQLQTKFGDPDKLSITQVEYTDYSSVYKRGDVLLMPRRYGGNCLPVNEALSCGMPVIMPDISPNNDWLPKEWLVGAQKVGEFTPRTTIDIYDLDPKQLAKKIDRFAAMDDVAMLTENVRANNLAESISWDYMRMQYEKALEDLCTQ